MVLLSLGRNKTTIIWVTTLLILAIINHSQAKKLPYGSPCNENKQCQESFSSVSSITIYNILKVDTNSVCKNSRCNCSQEQVRVFQNSSYKCLQNNAYTNIFSTGADQDSSHKPCKKNDTETCMNGECRGFDEFAGIIPNICKCNDGFVYDGVNCKEVVNAGYSEDCKSPENGPVPMCNYDSMMMCNSTMFCDCYEGLIYDSESTACMSKKSYMKNYPGKFSAGLNEFCGTSSDYWTFVCNATTNMSCQSSKCRCTSEFYPLEENKTCESKEIYKNEHNLTEYKVMPGVYCYNDDDCIVGLYCRHNKECACPYPCKYDSNISACDCGEVSATEGASPAILVGVIGGLCIIIFWGRLINNIMKEVKAKKTSRRQWELDHRTSSGPEYTEASTDADSNRNNSNLQQTSSNTVPYRIQTTTGRPGASSSSSITAAISEKSPLPKSEMSSSPYNPNPSYPSSNSELPPTYDSLYTAPSTAPAAAPQPYSHAPSNPTAPPTGFAAAPAPYPSASSYLKDSLSGLAEAPLQYPPTAPAAGPVPYSAAPLNPAASAESTSDVLRDAPPQIDIYKPII